MVGDGLSSSKTWGVEDYVNWGPSGFTTLLLLIK